MATQGDTSYSPNFTAADADVELVLSDSVHFLVHRKNLEVSSKIFEDMFDAGKLSAGEPRARVELAENADVLESLLPYCYSSSVSDTKLSSESWEIIRAAEKCQIGRALDAYRGAFVLRMTAETKNFSEYDFHAYVFANLCQFKDLTRRALRRLIDEGVTADDISSWSQAVSAHLPLDNQHLLELIDQRQVRAERCRASRGLALAASFKLKHPQAQWQDHSEIVATSWELWEKARNINAVSNLESLANTADSEMRHHQSSYTAWQKVEKAIRSLASDYRWISRSLVPE